MEERLRNKIGPKTKSGCTLWKSYKCTNGYGQIQIEGKIWMAHRLAWVLSNGAIPEGLYVLHKCDVRDCVNPEHLFLGTHIDNVADRDAKGRANHPKGEANGRAKLTNEDVKNIRSDNRLLREIAHDYKMSPKHISLIKTYKKWSHI